MRFLLILLILVVAGLLQSHIQGDRGTPNKEWRFGR